MNLEINTWNSEDFLVLNCNNPFEEAGLMIEEYFYDILLKTRNKSIDPGSLKSEFLSNISNTFSELNLSTDDYDFKEEEFLVCISLIDIYIKDGLDIYNFKSKKIENVINSSPFFNENQKKRVLVNSSILRHTINSINVFYLENEIGKSGPWADCFLGKLQELQDCGNCWLERTSCILSWPTCFGIKAIDCAIDLIF